MFKYFTFKGHRVRFLSLKDPISWILYNNHTIVMLTMFKYIVILAIKLTKIWRFDLILAYFITLGQMVYV